MIYRCPLATGGIFGITKEMKMQVCSVCKQPIDVCPYGGDCGEMQTIYREQQRKMLLDIDVSDMHNECMVCGCLIDDGYSFCYSCERGMEDN